MWNFGDMFDAVAPAVPPDRPALVHGGLTVPWAAFTRRTNNLAQGLLAAGLAPSDRLAVLSRNHPAYIETAVAALKARLVYVNINYRYTADEIAYVLRDCGARGLVYQEEFRALAAEIRSLAPETQVFVEAGQPGAPSNPDAGALSFESLAETGDGAPLAIKRSPDDGYLIYTGGTTGRPKGVMWRSHDARATQLESPLVRTRPADLAAHVALVEANPSPGRVIPACPLMHGAGINSSMAELASGGTVITLTSKRFDAEELWSAVEANRATRILIVGDVFARPMLAALERAPGGFDLSSLKVVSSSGLMWSAEVKAGLLKHLPDLTLVDILGSSEASGLGYAITTRDRATPTGLFEPGPGMTLIDPDTDRVLADGEEGEGLLARSGYMASGYFRDPDKTAEVFRTIDGVRYAIPGDMARRERSGLIQLVGRGNLCINTGGEKVFPEEVEEALKRHPTVEDALVIGLPDPTWGKAVAALIQSREGFDPKAVVRDLAANLAAYKIPKHLFTVAQIPRHESGKSDYRRAQVMAAEAAAAALSS
jgi:fatty-acyl-CoA synthase